MIFIIVLTILSLDQLSKYAANHYLQIGRSLPVIKGIFHLTLVYNRGAAFGILKNQIPLFIFTSLFALALICLEFSKNNHNRLYRWALILIFSGAAGNLIDRFIFGHVIDFLDFRIWPVFNLADSAITVGAVLLGWSTLRSKNKHGSQGHQVTRSPV